MSNEPAFSCPEDEISYWKRLTNEHKRREEEAREELDEFQMSSRELEAELEAQLEQAEQNMKDLRSNNGRLQMEVDSLRERLENLQATSHKQISDLEEELLKVKGFKDELQKYIRELEQSNDDLERTKRVTVVSLEDFEARLNMAIERNAFLESELEEREGMHVTVQRLKDEARDLRQELQVCKKDESVSVTGREVRKMASEFDKVEPMEQIDSNKLAESGDAYITAPVTPQRPVLHHSANGSPLTPSARISALNIVGDLLRKIGALESKLASCRNFVKDQPRSNKSGSTSPLNSPRSERKSGHSRSNRAKRLHRSATIGTAPVSTT